MHSLTPFASRVFDELIAGLGSVGDSKRIANNDTFVPVVVELIHESNSSNVFSVSHYGEHNGDLMADPDMTFLKSEAGKVFPLTYRNDWLGVNQVVLPNADSPMPKAHEALQACMVDFVQDWFRNINLQQDLGIS